MKKGFTLVELSIVLVIIGLLIGGILVGQSLISSAKIQKFTREIVQYDVVVSQFRDRYKSLPGDSTQLTPSGNGDDRVYSRGGWYDAFFDLEVAAFWKHISDAGMLQESYTNVNAGDLLIGENIPEIALGDNVGLLVGMPYGSGHVFPANTLVYQIRSSGIVGNNLTYASGSKTITTATALSVDTKMDDGITNTGEIRATSGGYIAGSNTLLCDGGTAGTYDVGNTDQNTCALAIRVFSQIGGE